MFFEINFGSMLFALMLFGKQTKDTFALLNSKYMYTKFQKETECDRKQIRILSDKLIGLYSSVTNKSSNGRL